MGRQYFGTDGIRGPVGGPLVNVDFAARLGAAVGAQLKALEPGGGEVLIGRDTRKSGEALRDGLAAGLASQGFGCIDLGVAPTPAVALSTLRGDAVLGVALTASHNPSTDNGFKFFGSSGRKVDDSWEAAVESRLEGEAAAAWSPLGIRDVGRETIRVYCEFVEGLFPGDLLEGLVLAVDTSNGATCESTPTVLRALGAKLVQMGDSPDGVNINAGVGSEHPQQMAAIVQEGSADLGLAHDGDGDRLVLCDESGSILSGDEVLGIVGLDWIRRGCLSRSTVVGTVQCNSGLEVSLAEAGGQLLRTPVGDRSVTRRMIAEGLNFGGEPSGHFVFSDCLPTGDGLIAALQVLEIRHRSGRQLGDLRKEVTLYPQAEVAIMVREKPQLESLPAFQQGLGEITRDLGGQGRVLVRYSGTEPKLRLLAEGPSREVSEATLKALGSLARNNLNTVDNVGPS